MRRQACLLYSTDSTQCCIIDPMGTALFKSFIKEPKNTSYEGEDRDERVKILVRRSLLSVLHWVLTSIIFFILPFFLIPFLAKLQYNGTHVFGGLFLTCFTLFWYIFLFGFILQCFFDWFFDVFLVTNKKIIDIDRGCTNISETPLRNVEDITSKMYVPWGQVFNVGSIFLQTAGETKEFEFEMLDDPSTVRDAISDLISEGSK